MKITKSQLREIIREEISKLTLESYGKLDGDQSDVLEGLVLFHSDKKDSDIVKIVKKDSMFKNVKESDLLKYIKDIRKIYRR
jgi:succinate dehydrogenase flavin-adding protein (antitoxin of CptAB toxin-antitoxin module)